MKYLTFQPQKILNSLVKCFWTLEIPAQSEFEKQLILPDGCIEMAFILGDDIKRYTSENEFIIQPRSMIIGQISEPFYIEPIANVNTFSVRFYPFGIANFINLPIENLANKETPIQFLFGETIANELEKKIIQSESTEERIKVIESFLISKISEKKIIENIVKTTVDEIILSNGSKSLNAILEANLSKRRTLERKFLKHIGLSPKKLGRIIRFQTALKLILRQESTKLTQIAYDSDYFDQAHFIKDFKEFTGTSPNKFLGNKEMTLSSLFYSER